MNPKHQNPDPQKPNRRAIAPYNFVPLPEKVVPAQLPLPDQDKYHPNRYSGHIQCVLTTKSPTYVRAATNPEFFRRWWSDEARQMRKMLANTGARVEYANFFHLDNAQQPVIPGSTLRGMIRTLVEIVGYGKVQWVTDEPKFTYRAVAAPKDDPLTMPYQQILGKYGANVRAGYLEQKGNEWFIVPAKWPSDHGWPENVPYLKVKDRHISRDALPGFMHFDHPKYIPQYHQITFNIDIREGKKGEFITISDLGSIEAGYHYSGFLVCSGNMLETRGDLQNSPRNKQVIVLEKDSKATALKMNPQAIEDYVAGLTQFQKSPPFDERMGCLVNGRPVFYVVGPGKEVFFFGHSPNFRIPAWRSGTQRAATALDFVPSALRKEEMIDLSEAIFGYVKSKQIREGKDRAYAGRVFFCDADFKSAENEIWLSEKPITPQILASPKPTTFQHYLTQQEPNNKKQLDHYASPPPHDTVIRGHKLYWHKGPVGKLNIQEKEKVDWSDDTQHTQIKPVKAEVSFSFRIRFENLNEVELGALLWALMLPGEDDHDYCHKVGMGKPLGMGAVKLTTTLHRTLKRSRYIRLLDDEGQWYQPQNSEIDPQPFIQAFEQHVLDHMDPTERNAAQSLKDVPRIQMLLKMLEWPGPMPIEDKTRYMEIERDMNKPHIGTPKKGKVNEYADRPVLPDPLDVVFPGLSSKSKSSSKNKSQTVTPSDPTEVKIKRFIEAIEAIQSDKVAGQIRDYYDQWQNVEANEALKRQLAIAICKRVESSPFRKKANKKKKWYQELKASLPEEAWK